MGSGTSAVGSEFGAVGPAFAAVGPAFAVVGPAFAAVAPEFGAAAPKRTNNALGAALDQLGSIDHPNRSKNCGVGDRCAVGGIYSPQSIKRATTAVDCAIGGVHRTRSSIQRGPARQPPPEACEGAIGRGWRLTRPPASARVSPTGSPGARPPARLASARAQPPRHPRTGNRTCTRPHPPSACSRTRTGRSPNPHHSATAST